MVQRADSNTGLGRSGSLGDRNRNDRVMKQILVTGGAGYIGSHTVLMLIEAGYRPVIFDNWSNSNPVVIKRLEGLSGTSVPVIEGDLRSLADLERAFAAAEIDAVVHFAGLKAVGESHQMPLEYYQNNVGGTLNLMTAMREAGCHRLVFSSSATVYGDPEVVPIQESAPLRTTNPYGETKLMIERILLDTANADSRLRVALLRYFNPVGAHPSGQIGEDPQGIPNNLVPYIAQVAVGRRPMLSIFGNDYETPDGTGVRDYIHVQDLASAHVAALHRLGKEEGCEAYNIGTGTGYSVLEVVAAFEAASQVKIAYQLAARRVGDIASCYADASKAERLLGWRAQHDLADMMADHWRWQQRNPNGFD